MPFVAFTARLESRLLDTHNCHDDRISVLLRYRMHAEKKIPY